MKTHSIEQQLFVIQSQVVLNQILKMPQIGYIEAVSLASVLGRFSNAESAFTVLGATGTSVHDQADQLCEEILRK
jgi:hypothetical protein